MGSLFPRKFDTCHYFHSHFPLSSPSTSLSLPFPLSFFLCSLPCLSVYPFLFPHLLPAPLALPPSPAVPSLRLPLLYRVLCPGSDHGGRRVSGCDCPQHGGWNHPPLQSQEHSAGHWVRGHPQSFAAGSCIVRYTDGQVEGRVNG